MGNSGPTGEIRIYDAGTTSFVSSIALDRNDVFTLAFADDAAVPAPGTLAMLGLGLGLLGFARRRKA